MKEDNLTIKMFKKLPISLIIFTAVTLTFCWPITHNITYWGQKDWDQFIFWYSAARRTILEYHQLPLWNPYVNGGNVLLAHPHSSWLGPFYSFILVLGSVAGIKLLIFIHAILGLAGMFFLARFFGLPASCAYLSAFLYMLNAIFPLHLTEGHVEFLSIAYIPWILLFFLKSGTEQRYIIYTIVSLALMLFSGSVYPLMILVIFTVALSFLRSLKIKNFSCVKTVSLVLLGFLALSSVKMIPMLEFVRENPRVARPTDGMDLHLLATSLNDAKQELYDVKDYKPTGVNEWHEYGAYVGGIPLVLFLFGVLFYFKKHWPLIATSALSLVVVLGNKFFFDPWRLFQRLPIFSGLSANSRFILGFMIGFSILAGFGLFKLYDILIRLIKNKRIPLLLVALLTVLVLCDLITVNSVIFRNAFVIKPLKIKPLMSFCQIEGEILDKRMRSSLYPAFLLNCGVVNGYEVIQIKRGQIHTLPENLKDILEDPDRENITRSHCKIANLVNNYGKIKALIFSPNIIKISAELDKADTLVLNQNYSGGWKIREQGFTIMPFRGLLAVRVPKGKHQITFYYLPNSFLLGATISIFCLLFLLYFYTKIKHV